MTSANPFKGDTLISPQVIMTFVLSDPFTSEVIVGAFGLPYAV